MNDRHITAVVLLSGATTGSTLDALRQVLDAQTRRPDRVMMKDGRLVVVDFKFGKPSKKYNRQVKDYMQLLTRMGYDPKQMEGYLWYVTEGRTEKV